MRKPFLVRFLAHFLVRALIIGAVSPGWMPSPASANDTNGFEASGPVPADTELEASGAVIGEVLVDNQNIFNLDDPKDNTKLFRLANRLHVKTRASVIRSQLLFRPGDRYSRRVLDESERILRSAQYFYDAWIVPVSYHDGKVDLRVTTRDVWTLDPGFNYGRSGGKNETGYQLQDINLLGTGAAIVLEHSNDIDRTESLVQLSDTHAFNTWTSVSASYGNFSDGGVRQVIINRPFYSLETQHAGGLVVTNQDLVDSLYDRGNIVDQFHDRTRFAQVYTGWSAGLQNGWVRRWSTGFTYDERLFTPAPNWAGPALIPYDRRYAYPWIRFDLLEDDYLKTKNHDQIERTEDFYLGTTATVRVGWADSSLGSTRSALMFQSAAGQGYALSRATTLLLSSAFTGRVEDGSLHNGVLAGAVRYYAQLTKNWLFFTTLKAAKGWRLDLENQLLLGGDNGLRGYPLRYQDGTERALLTIEQRYFTDWYPFRLFRVGGAVFFDAGRTWGSPPLAAPNLGLLKDVGFGLRFGNSRSGLGNVIHVDLAFPLDGDSSIQRVQFLVATQEQF